MTKELTASSILVRSMQPSDYRWALALNNSTAPHVSTYNEYNFPRFVELAAWAAVAMRNNKPVGFAILFLPGSTYSSENYRWVAARHTRFLFLDRVIVEPSERRRGIGRTLCDKAIEFGRRRAPIMTSAVNEEPANPESILFHEKLGFRRLGQLKADGGKKSVAIMGLDLE
jgi:predicted GNAT superfamily acetyltransferase